MLLLFWKSGRQPGGVGRAYFGAIKKKRKKRKVFTLAKVDRQYIAFPEDERESALERQEQLLKKLNKLKTEYTAAVVKEERLKEYFKRLQEKQEQIKEAKLFSKHISEIQEQSRAIEEFIIKAEEEIARLAKLRRWEEEEQLLLKYMLASEDMKPEDVIFETDE